MKEFINDRITDRLKSAIDLPDNKTLIDSQEAESEIILSSEDEIVTTQEEMEGFYIIKAILREVIEVERIQFKDTKSYFGINVDGKVGKTICRLRFNSNAKVIGIVDAEGKEAKKTIANLSEIYGVAEIIKDRAKYLTQDSSVKDTSQI